MKDSIGKEFLLKTRFPYSSTSPQNSGAPQPPLELAPPANALRISLPHPSTIKLPAQDLRKVIEARQTIRSYSEQPVNLDELSYLLWLTQGVRHTSPRPVTLRNVPSAGARHAFETYLLVNRVESLPAGLYRFAALDHTLLQMDLSPDITEKVKNGCNKQAQVARSAVTFIWAAVPERMYWRYTERGYRYLLLDAGHICQNLYLAAETVNCGVCAIASFDDELLNNALGLDGETIFALYAASLGKRQPKDD